MPTYLYKCKKCSYEFELRQPFGAPKPDRCMRDGCDGEVAKVFVPPAIIFKGPGFHVTDYGRGGGNGKSRPRPKDAESEKASASVGEDKE